MDEKIKSIKFNCKICNEKFEMYGDIKTHVIKAHDYKSYIDYYDENVKLPGDDICKECGETTYFSKVLYKYSPLCMKHIKGVTLNKLIIKYGVDDGTYKYQKYQEKQSVKNTFEHKKEKYGWTEDKFKKFNSSRAVTEENLIKKHGDIKGREMYNQYCERQSYAGCKLEYFIEKYGVEEGTLKYNDINFKKSHTLESYTDRYGSESLAREKLEEFFQSRDFGFHSKISQELFNNIITNIGRTDNIYFKQLNKEFGSMSQDGRYYFYDFVDNNTKTVIEFNGIKFHVKDDTKEFTQLYSGKSKEYVIERDFAKKSHIESRGYYVHIVWEDDYYNNKMKCLNECISLLKERELND